jgi:tight adherence protein B
MLIGSIQALLLFFLVSIFCLAVLEAIMGGPADRAHILRRMKGSESGTPAIPAGRLLLSGDVPVWLRDTLIERPYQSLLRFYAQSGLTTKPEYFLLAGLALSVCVALLITASRSLLTGGFSPQQTLFAFVGAALMGISGCVAFIALRRRQRKKKLDAQFPDALNVMISALKVGHPISTALRLAAEDNPEPMAGELRRIGNEIRYGVDLLDAFEEFSERCGVQDGFFIAAAISVGAKTGGQLASVLERANGTLRDRVILRKKSSALASESQTTAIIMSLLPVVFLGFVLVVSPDYYAEHVNDPIFERTVTWMSVLYFIGVGLFIRICTIKL